MRAAQAELGTARAGAIVEEALARLALDARDAGARRFVVAGGETSGAVTHNLDVLALARLADLNPELNPRTLGPFDRVLLENRRRIRSVYLTK